jgi:hypothetical protein
VLHRRLGAGLAKNPNSVDHWRWHDPVEVQMVSPSDMAADTSEALGAPAEGQLWRALIRAPRRVVSPGATLRVYGLSAAVEFHLKVENVVADWQEVSGSGEAVA